MLFTALEALGWTLERQRTWKAEAPSHLQPARVAADFGSVLKVLTPEERQAEIVGRMLYDLVPAELPKVGDWVGVHLVGQDTAAIEYVLPRTSEIARRQAGTRLERQVMAANVDVAFIVQALDHDFSPERMQRYLYQLAGGQIQPILILNKADQINDREPFLERIRNLDVPYIVTSAQTGDGMTAVADYIQPGKTAVFLGSSGVGKSTITNKLLGSEAQKTQAIRSSDSKGRHTTTHRELFVLPNGGILIDTPGIRELQLWGTEEALDDTFADVLALTATCRFSNCSHTSEPDCAIQAALKNHTLDLARWHNFQKMQKEVAYLETKVDPRAARLKKQAISKNLKQHYKARKQSPKG